MVRPARPLSYLFALDVSSHAVQSGALSLACTSLLSLLDSFPVTSFTAPDGTTHYTSPTRIGILTYDRHVHFYNLSPRQSRFQMLVVPDLDDIFVPLSDGLFVDIAESRELIVSLLTALPGMFGGTQVAGNALGAALEAGLMALEATGGRVIAMTSSIPSLGRGALKARDEANVVGSDKERQLYVPQGAFYKKIGVDCSNAGVGVDIFITAQGAVDLATLGVAASLTGGTAFYYPRFNATKHGMKFSEELKRTIVRTHGYEAVLRVRASNGLRVQDYFGNMYMKASADVELASIDSDKALGVVLAHDGKLDERTDAVIQTALLYTTALGERRIRIHTLSLRTSSSFPDVYRSLDMDAIVNIWSKMAVQSAAAKPLAAVRQDLNDNVIAMLACYREKCASNNPPAQLVLPELVKLLPVVELCMTKSTPFRLGVDMAVDERIDAMRFINEATTRATAQYFYPTLVDVMALDISPVDEDGRVYARAEAVRLSYEMLDAARVYVLENGVGVMVWVGAATPSAMIKCFFDVPYLENVDLNMVR